MNITILCSSKDHPVINHIEGWIDQNSSKLKIYLVNNKEELKEGDILFLISCTEILSSNIRKKFKKCLVIHASDLPNGRGWSPHVWQILEGCQNINVSLIEAEDTVDTGDVWKKLVINIPKDYLYDEINQVLFDAHLELMNFAIENFTSITPRKQSTNTVPSYYKKRTPKDSKLDIQKTISEQFELLRVCDPDRYPAYFEIYGHKYRIKIDKI